MDKILPKKAIDEHWYARFIELWVEVLTLLEGDKNHRAQQRGAFLSSQVRNPVLDYPHLNLDKLAQREHALLSLHQEIQQTEPNKIVRQAWCLKVEENLTELKMLKATVTKDYENFMKFSQQVYGQPSPDVFFSIAREVDEKIKIPGFDAKNKEPGKAIRRPDLDTIQQVRDWMSKDLGLVVAGLEGTTMVEAAYLKEVFERTLDQLNLPVPWRVVVDRGSRIAITVSMKERTIYIPSTKTMTLQALRGLIVHELSHVIRVENGHGSGLKLLAVGLHQYLRGEEGVAIVREDSMRRSLDEWGKPDRHLAIGLAVGLDGQPRDFREVYEIMKRHYEWRFLRRGAETVAAETMGQTEAWNTCVRTFRGTDCATPGAALVRDIVYHEGMLSVWGVIQDKPERMKWFNVGKFNPANQDHWWILEQLGIVSG